MPSASYTAARMSRSEDCSPEEPAPARGPALGVVSLVLAASVCFAGAANAADAPEATNFARDLLLVLGLILINALFSMAEAALLSVRRSRIDQLVEEGNRAARLASRLMNDPTRMLSTLQVGVTLVGLFSAGVAAEHLVDPLAAWLSAQVGSGFIAEHAKAIAFGVTILGVSLVSLVVGEITPKSIAIRHAEKIALVTVYPMTWLQTFATPIVALVTSLSSVLTRPFGVTAGFHPSALGEDELRLLVEQSEEHGVIDSDEKEMIHSIFDFGDTLAREVMTPRLDVVGLPVTADVATLVKMVEESGHSRLPVYEGDLDRIVGIVHIKDTLRALAAGRLDAPIKELMRPPYFIPENKLVADLMTELRNDKGQLALVRDEYGTFTGVVTLEDLLEEIVGEIRDEHEREVEDVLLSTLEDHTFLVSGRMSMDEFNERMGTELPVDEADTFGGFVFGLFGRQPVQGETVEAAGFAFQVDQTDGRRILKVKVTRQASPTPASQAAEKEVS